MMMVLRRFGGQIMLLECNEIKLLIINLDNISSEFDDDLSDLVDYKECVFILSDDSRAEQLEEYIDDFSYISPPSFRYGSLYGHSYYWTVSRILREKKVDSHEVVYITGDAQEPYNNKGIATVLLANDDTVLDKNNLPDHHASDIPSLIKCLKGKSYGYYGELCADGSVSSKGWFLFSKLSHELIPSVETDLIVFGRYFVSHDSRSYIHPLSQLILRLKSGYQKQMNVIARVFSKSVNHLYRNGMLDVDIITMVPPKPGKNNILLEVISASKNLGKESLDENIQVAELLQLRENYKPQKDAGSFTNRIINVRGKFGTNKKVSGHIVLVDDIITSGATALECAKVLYAAGAEKVTVLALGASQNRSEASTLDHLKCDICDDGEYRLRFGTSAFYGCSNWPKCKSTKSYEIGRKRYNASRKLVPNPLEEENDDDDIF